MIDKVSNLYKKHLLAFVIGPFLKIIEAFFDLLIPLIMKAVIDLAKYKEISLIPQNNKISIFFGNFIRSFGVFIKDNQMLNDALIGLFIILAMGIIGFALTMITQYIAAKVASNIGQEIRLALFNKAMSFSLNDKNDISSAKLLTIINNDTYTLSQGILYFIRLIVRAPFIITGALIISFILDWRIGLIFLAIVPLILLIIFFVMKKSAKKYLIIQNSLEDVSRKTSDSIAGYKTIKSYSKEQDEIDDFADYTDSFVDKSIAMHKLNSLVNPLSFAITSCAIIAIVLFLGKTIIDLPASEGTLLASTIIAEVSYLSQIFITLVLFTTVILNITKASVAQKRIDEVLAISPKVNNSNKKIKKEINLGDEILSFKHVYLSYQNNENYDLNDISFSLKKGDNLGIIGTIGSGKTSLINLIERFIDSSKGEIKYKGVNILDYDLSSLREDIGLVPQKSILLKGSIKQNITMGKDGSNEQISKVISFAKADEFVNAYADKLDHLILQDGKNLSGGQKQRLCLARALYKNPELLILDDATSSLDLLTEKQIKENINNNYANTSKIIISQRISSIKNLNSILVLDKGRIIAYGSHDELLKNCEIYRQTYLTQVEEAT